MADQFFHTFFLRDDARVGKVALRVEAAFVADADATTVVWTGMGTHLQDNE